MPWNSPLSILTAVSEILKVVEKENNKFWPGISLVEDLRCKGGVVAGTNRELGTRISTVPADQIRKIRVGDFEQALRQIKPSVSPEQQRSFDAWTGEYGTSS